MALFTDTRELDRQGSIKPFRGVTGFKKTALAALGYNPDGTRNWWGKTVMNNPGSHYASKHIAGKESDTGKVIDSSETESWQAFGATAKMALNLITLGGASGATAGASAAGTAAAGGGTAAGTTAATSAATTAGTTAAKTGTQAMAAASEQTAKDASMDALNSNYSEQTIDGVTTTSVGDFDLNEDEMLEWQQYLEKNPEATMEEFQAEQGLTKEAKQAANAAKMTKAIPIIGDAANMVATRAAESSQLKKEKKRLSEIQNKQTFNYL
tara:strand:- start:1445 stop:2248 length:804 start_codon:yes stop_codon:yes gene_type:complete